MSKLNQFFSKKSSLPIGSARVISYNNASDLTPPNTIIDDTGTWLKSGQVYLQASYPELYAQLGKIDAADYVPISSPYDPSYGPTKGVQTVGYANGNYFLYGGTGLAGSVKFVYSTDAITWNLSSLVSNNTATINTVAYGTGLYVLGSSNGSINTSTNISGTFTSVNSFTSLSINEMKYLGNKFVYLQNTIPTIPGSVGTSTDGITWTANNSSTESTITSISYANGLYIHTAAGGSIRTSTDLINWNAIVSGTSSAINGASWGNGFYVVAGAGGMVRYSTDLVTWAAATSGTTSILSDVAYGTTAFGPSYHVAVGAGGTIRISGAASGTWTSVTSNTTTTINTVDYIDGKIVALGTGGLINTSTDGTTWVTKIIQSQTSTNFSGLTYGNGKFVAVGAAGTVRTSTDGLAWAIVTSNTASALTGATYGNALYVAAGATGALISSTDAITWTARTSGTTSAINAIIHDGSKFVAAGAGGMIRTSTNLVTWAVPASGTTSIIYATMYNSGTYFVLGAGGMIRTSTDLITWTPRTSGTTNTYYSIMYGNGKYVAVGNAIVSSSTDGVTWVTSTPPVSVVGTSPTLRTVVYDGNKYVALGYSVTTSNPAKCTSTDGITWLTKDDNTGAAGGTPMQACVFVNSKIYAAGYSGVISIHHPENTVNNISGFRFGATNTFGRPFKAGTTYYINTKQSTLLTSTDLVTWSTLPISDTISTVQLTYSPTQNLFVKLEAGNMYTSTNLSTWSSSVYAAPQLSSVLSCGFVNNKVVFYGSNGVVSSSYYADQYPGSWNTLPNLTIPPLDITYGNNTYVVVGNSGGAAISNDGNNWTTVSTGTTATLYNVTYGNSIFVANGYSGSAAVVRTSTDGITWTAGTVTGQTTISLRAVSYKAGMFKGVSLAGNAATSTDGVNWSSYLRVVPTTIAGTSANIEGPVDVVTSSDTFIYVSNNIGKQYSPTYNVNTSFYIPTVNTGNTFAVSASSYDTEATSIIYVKAK